jgi:hypothetical protein
LVLNYLTFLNVNLLTIRPRTTELKLQGIIIDTEKNRNNEGGKPESIYKLRSETLLEKFDINVSEHKPNAITAILERTVIITERRVENKWMIYI